MDNKFKLEIPKPALPPTEQEEKFKNRLLDQMRTNEQKNCTELLRWVNDMLNFMQINRTHVAFLQSKDKIVIKRVLKTHTILVVEQEK